MAHTTILAVDDEADLLELVRYNLIREGFDVVTAATGEEALVTIRKEPPDLILLDLMLPKMGGFTVMRRLTEDDQLKQIPVIMLTAKGEEADVITGLELGADDYVTKPFSPKILVARIRSVLRRIRTLPPDTQEIRIHELFIDTGRRVVLSDQKPVELTYTEFQILTFLAARPGWVYTRSQIIDAIRGDDYPVTDRSVDVQIVGLRKKLGMCGSYIETVRGVGYRFREAP